LEIYFLIVSSPVLGIVRTIVASEPHSSLWASKTKRFGLPYWALSIFLNVAITVCIVTKLFITRKLLRETMGPEYGRAYTGVAAMLIESAAPYALVGVILLVLYGLGDTAMNLFIPVYCQVQVS
jgi:hypothetical protein